MTSHQQKQKDVIDSLEDQVKKNSMQFTTVSPVEDFEHDTRICLTSVHIPSVALMNQVQEQIIKPLLAVSSDLYAYSNDSLHMTIKNVRVINDPPHFAQQDILKAKKVFSDTVLKHNRFNVHFYRLLLFPNNLALVGTTDPELDALVLELDQKLKEEGVPDDKVYSNNKYFFSNMTLMRFSNPLTEEFKHKIEELSHKLHFEPYVVDSVSLITANAVLKSKTIIGTWGLK
jgi:hypothetical protein